MPRGAIALMLAALAILQAQEKAPDVSIKTAASEVVLDLIVRDKKGRPVKDLKPEDVEVTEDGGAVSIKTLHLTTVGGGADPESKAATNLDPTRQVRLITFLFERMNREPANLARRAAVDVVNRASGPNVYFAVLVVRERLRPIQLYTNDKAALKKALDAVAGEGATRIDGLAQQAETVIQSMVQSVQQSQDLKTGNVGTLAPPTSANGAPDSSAMGGFAEAARAQLLLNMMRASEQMTREWSGRSSLRSLRAAVEQQRPLPGRKTLVYFSEGLQIATSLEHQFKAVIGAANAAGVSIYCVDATGLDITERTRASTDMLRAAAQGSMETVTAGSDQPVKREQVMALDNAEQSIKANNFTALAELSSSTGGFLIADTNDLSKSAQRLAEDVNAYYELSYVPPASEFDGRFHAVSVKVKRPGVKAQTRSGYFALPPNSGSAAAAFELPMLKALTAGAAAFPFASGVLRLDGTGGHVRGVVMADVPLSQVSFVEDPASKALKLPIAFLAVFRDNKGTIASKVSRELLLQLPRERAKNASEGVFSWREPFEIPAGDYTVETVVWDRGGDRMSLKRDPFTARSSEGLDLSDVVSVKQFAPAQEGADELLRYDKSRITPGLDRKFALAGRDGSIPLFFRLTQTDPASPVRLSIRAIHDGVEIANNPLPAPSGAASGSPYVASIPTASLQPGEYELAIRAEQGSASIERSLKLHLDWAPGATKPTGPHVETGSGGSETASLPEPVRLEIAPIAELSGMLAPEQAEQAGIIDALKRRAAEYVKSLPNFFCIQATRRLVDGTGSGNWKERDSWQDVLSYVDGREHYRRVKLNDAKDEASKASERVSSRGEFGGVLDAVFSEKSAATFKWKAWAELNGEKVHVFEYKVLREHSRYALTWDGRWEGRSYWRADPAYDGEIFVDAQTYDVKRITLRTGAVPPKFPIQQATHEIDYQLTKIGDVERMMPVQAVMQSRVGARRLVRNEIRFREYGMWGAKSAVSYEK